MKTSQVFLLVEHLQLEARSLRGGSLSTRSPVHYVRLTTPLSCPRRRRSGNVSPHKTTLMLNCPSNRPRDPICNAPGINDFGTQLTRTPGYFSFVGTPRDGDTTSSVQIVNYGSEYRGLNVRASAIVALRDQVPSACVFTPVVRGPPPGMCSCRLRANAGTPVAANQLCGVNI